MLSWTIDKLLTNSTVPNAEVVHCYEMRTIMCAPKERAGEETAVKYSSIYL
jgi:hypothetical protein